MTGPDPWTRLLELSAALPLMRGDEMREAAWASVDVALDEILEARDEAGSVAADEDVLV